MTSHSPGVSGFSYYRSEISADGKQIAYAWHNTENYFDLRVASADGLGLAGGLRQSEMECTGVYGWFPGNRRVLATFSGSGASRIAAVSVDDGSLVVIKTLDWRSSNRLSLSPGGRFVAYSFPPDDGSPQRDIFLLSAGVSSFQLVPYGTASKRNNVGGPLSVAPLSGETCRLISTPPSPSPKKQIRRFKTLKPFRSRQMGPFSFVL